MDRPSLRRHARVLAALVVLALALLACGQKPGVYIERGPFAGSAGAGDDGMGGGVPAPTDDATAEGGAGGPGEVEAELPDLEGGEGTDPTGGAGTAGGSSDGGGDAAAPAGGDGGNGGSGGDGGSGGGDGDGGNDGGGGDAPEQAAAREPRGSDRTGLTDDTITLAVHAPVTGAAPLPATSFERARDLYWRWVIEEEGDVLGRTEVEVIFADDKYEPSTAIQVCRQLAARAFLVAGGGGTDQIQACGRFAGQAQVPYFSAGVTETGLSDNPWYFAASMTYRQQGPLLADYVRANFGGQKVGAIVTQTRNFDDAVQGWESSLDGIDYAGTLRHPKGDTSWYATYARQLADDGVEVVYMLTSPLDYIRFAQTAADQGVDFQYVGVGITKGLNDVLGSGCPAVDGGVFFSPFPALETADEIDPDFRRAAARYGVPVDDIAWAIWGTSKLQHELFRAYEEVYGDDLTREDFREVVANAGTVSTGVFPDVNITPDNHFGGTGVHVLEADCGSQTYRNGGTFATGF